MAYVTTFWDEQNMACIMKVTFGTLFNDDQCANIFEALVGTLRAAKKRKIVAYDGELLLQGVHDNVEITLNPTPTVAAINWYTFGGPDSSFCCLDHQLVLMVGVILFCMTV